MRDQYKVLAEKYDQVSPVLTERLTEQLLSDYVALMVEAAQLLSLTPLRMVSDTYRAKLQPSSYWPKITPSDTFEGIRENYLTALNAAVKFDLYNGNFTPVIGTFKRSQYQPEVIGSLRSDYQFTPGNLNTADAKQAIKDEIEDKGYRSLIEQMYEINKDSFWQIKVPWQLNARPLPAEAFQVVRNYVSGRSLDELEKLYLGSSRKAIKAAQQQNIDKHKIDLRDF